MKKLRRLVLILIAIFILLHITPQMAIRTHVIFMGYPVAAVTSGIVEYESHNKTDRERLEKLNAKVYTLTNPPVEEATQGELRNFIVKKYGFIYFAEYYGHG
ncbi:hypothetical protein ACFO3D_18525 [Virgibacillus kekensis]|uniref:Uncharacterized protein n=1 Tax=Virgibacillus kekensis TaxID=202261 RepID=A0ABV9DP00_9BACI